MERAEKRKKREEDNILKEKKAQPLAEEKERQPMRKQKAVIEPLQIRMLKRVVLSILAFSLVQGCFIFIASLIFIKK